MPNDINIKLINHGTLWAATRWREIGEGDEREILPLTGTGRSAKGAIKDLENVEQKFDAIQNSKNK